MNQSKPYRIIVDVLLILFCLIFPHAGWLPIYLYPVVVLLVIWAYLRFYKENFSTIGFRFRDLSGRAFLYGSAIGLLYACFAWWILQPMLSYAGLPPPDVSSFAYLKHNIIALIVLLLVASLLAIPYEEIVFRGYIFTRIKAYFKNTRYPFLIAGIITSILFAAYHYQEGWGAVVGIFIFALFTMYLYRLFSGNLWYLIFFHIAYDIFMLTAIYLGFGG